MAARHTDPALRPFSQGGYEIRDEAFESRREVAIRSADSMAPRLGDLFTVERCGVAHEVAVVRLVTFQGGWSAVCRVIDVF